MKAFKAVKLVLSLSTQPTGAVVQRQIFERGLVLSDQMFGVLCELVVLLDYGNTLALNVYDFCFVGWAEDLLLIRQAVYELFQEQKIRQYG